MTIGRVVEKTGLSRHTLRYYEKIGIIKPVLRNKSGHRNYTDEDMEIIGFVLKMKTACLPIKDIVSYIALLNQGEKSYKKRLEILQRHKEHIEKRLEDTGELLRFINRKIEWYVKHGAKGTC
jgi:DNA-binding transcriptional MerR regulator